MKKSINFSKVTSELSSEVWFLIDVPKRLNKVESKAWFLIDVPKNSNKVESKVFGYVLVNVIKEMELLNVELSVELSDELSVELSERSIVDL